MVGAAFMTTGMKLSTLERDQSGVFYIVCTKLK